MLPSSPPSLASTVLFHSLSRNKQKEKKHVLAYIWFPSCLREAPVSNAGQQVLVVKLEAQAQDASISALHVCNIVQLYYTAHISATSTSTYCT